MSQRLICSFRCISNCLLLLFFMGTVGIAFAQPSPVTVETSVDRNEITIGDPIRFTVRWIRPNDATFLDSTRLEQLGAFEILSERIGEEQITGQQTIREDQYLISLYEIGEFEVPAVKMRYRLADGSEGQAESGKQVIQVVSILTDPLEAQDIRDIKPPVILGKPNWQRLALFLAMLLALVLTVFFAYRVFRRSRKPREIPAPPPLPAHEIAFAALTQLRKDEDGFLARRDFETFSIRVSDILREYLHGRFELPAEDRTTEETLHELSRLGIQEDCLGRFKEFLEDCDLVKFAQEALDQKDMFYLIDLAWRLVEETREQPQPDFPKPEPDVTQQDDLSQKRGQS